MLRPRRAPRDLTVRVLLAAAALLSLVALARLPYRRGFWPTETPFDRWPNSDASRDFRFLSAVAPYVPPGASVVALTNPPDLSHDFYLHAFALSLLPGRRVLCASIWGVSYRDEALRRAEFVAVMGPTPHPPPGIPIFETPLGGIWRRAAEPFEPRR